MKHDPAIEQLSSAYPCLRPIRKIFSQVQEVDDELAQLDAQRPEIVGQHNLLKVPPSLAPGRQESKADMDRRANLVRGVEQKRKTLDVKVRQLKDEREHLNHIEARNCFTTGWAALLSETESLRNSIFGRFIEQFSASMGRFFPGLGDEQLRAIAESCFCQTPASASLGEIERNIFSGSGGALSDCAALVARFGELAALKKRETA